MASSSASSRRRSKRRYVQHRAEHLAVELAERVDLEQRRARERRRPRTRATADCGSGWTSAGAAGAHRCARVRPRRSADRRRWRSRAGSPTRSSLHGPLAASSAPGAAISCCRHSTRSDEQRCPAESKAERSTSATTCSGSARGIDDHRVLSAGLGDQRHLGDAAARMRAIARAVAVEPVNTTPRMRASETQLRADTLARARQQLQHRARYARAAQQLCGQRGNRGGLLGRLGEHGIARSQCRRDLTGEDRERKIPRADAQATGPSGTCVTRVELGADLRRVVAQMIHRLAHLADRVRNGPAGLAHHARNQRRRVLFI